MKTLYEITGKINDINTLLVNKREYDNLTNAKWQQISTAPTDGSNILTRTKVGAETSIREAQFSGQFDSNGNPIFRLRITNNLCIAQEWMPIPSFME